MRRDTGNGGTQKWGGKKKSNSDVIIVKSTTIMQENCKSHVQRTDNILMRSTKDWCPPLSPFWKIFHPLPLFEKYLEGFCLYMLPVLGYSTKEELFTFNGQPGALECPTHGIGHQASVPPSILVGHISDVQNLRFGQVERRLLKYKKVFD